MLKEKKVQEQSLVGTMVLKGKGKGRASKNRDKNDGICVR